MIQKKKCLGVVTDNALKRKDHIKTVSDKVSKAIGFLRHAKTFIPQKHLRPYTLALRNHTLDIVALFGVALVQLRLINYKNFNKELLEFYPTAASATHADC